MTILAGWIGMDEPSFCVVIATRTGSMADEATQYTLYGAYSSLFRQCQLQPLPLLLHDVISSVFFLTWCKSPARLRRQMPLPPGHCCLPTRFVMGEPSILTVSSRGGVHGKGLFLVTDDDFADTSLILSHEIWIDILDKPQDSQFADQYLHGGNKEGPAIIAGPSSIPFLTSSNAVTRACGSGHLPDG
jgi:hypothetical protein